MHALCHNVWIMGKLMDFSHLIHANYWEKSGFSHISVGIEGGKTCFSVIS